MDPTNRKITKIAREMSKFTQRMLKIEGVGVAEYDFIHVVRKNPGITQKEICEKLGIDKGAAAKRCMNLEAKGYLKKVKNPHDGRSHQIYPCEQAEQLKISKAMVESFAYEWLFEAFNEEETKQFCQLLDKIYQKSKQESKAEFIHLTQYMNEKQR